ncbi:hypothetical protein CR513_11441, partial [Mucuna pruriens]
MTKAAEKGSADSREAASVQPFWGQPFSVEIDENPIEPYDGTQDPHAHLQAFQTQMYISGGNDKLSCKLFPGTLRGVAMHWMATLPARSIQTFSDLANSFVSQFAAHRVKRLEMSNLFDIKQDREESLKSFLAWFNNATIRVDDPDQKFFVKAFQKGLRVGPFNDALALRRPVSMEEIRAHAEKHIKVEEDQIERREAERDLGHKESRCPAMAKEDRRPVQSRARDPAQHFTLLTKKRAQILREISHTTLLEFPEEAKGKVIGPDRASWCDFHRTFSHSTMECWILRTQIEKLVQKGHIRQYVLRPGGK